MTDTELILQELKNHSEILQQLVVGQGNMQKRMDSMDDRMASMESRMDSLDNRLVSVEEHVSSMDKRLVSVEDRLVSVENEVKSHNDVLHQLVLNQESMQKRVMNIEKDVAKIKITMENEVSPAIKTLTELHIDTSKRIVDLENNVQELMDNAAIDEVIRNIKMN